jgi:hypothetical protein
MQQRNSLVEPGFQAPDPRTAPRAPRPVAPRPITPTDGAVVHHADVQSVYCATCQRWIDCLDGIAPETALDRHGDLFH